VLELPKRAFRLALVLLCAGEAQAQVTSFPCPTAQSRPYTIVAGPDGNLWFTQSNGNNIARITPAGVITEFPVPTAQSGPYGICVGGDGNIWFTERFGNRIARFTIATQTFREFDLPTPFAQPWEIALGPSGNLWFTEEDVNQIGRITPTGTIREFVPPACCFPTGITAGSDGRMWFTLEIGDQIGRVESNGTMTMFTIPNVQVLPWDIAPGPDGALWFTELAGRAVGRISTSGQIEEHPVAGPFSGISGVTTGPDGNLWFVENDTDHVGAMDPSTGNVLGTLDLDPGARAFSVTLGPDGNIWFTQGDTNSIGRLATAAPGRAYALALDAAFSPEVRRVKLGQRMQWTFLGPNTHSVADASGLGLFDSGPRTLMATYVLACPVAGTFVYGDNVGATPDAAFTVPVTLPPTASVGVPFPVVWALVRPPGLVFDVQVKTPGAPAFSAWQSGPSRRLDYTALAAGPHQFRARLRDPVGGAATLYSAAATIVVQ